MRMPKWLAQMLALLGQRAGISPAKPSRKAIFDETLEQLDNTPTPRLCQRCWNTRPSCRCPQGFAVLPIGSEEPLADEHPTRRGSNRLSDRPPGRLPPQRPFPHPPPPKERKR